jgi:hypothetical protein
VHGLLEDVVFRSSHRLFCVFARLCRQKARSRATTPSHSLRFATPLLDADAETRRHCHRLSRVARERGFRQPSGFFHRVASRGLPSRGAARSTMEGALSSRLRSGRAARLRRESRVGITGVSAPERAARPAKSARDLRTPLPDIGRAQGRIIASCAPNSPDIALNDLGGPAHPDTLDAGVGGREGGLSGGVSTRCEGSLDGVGSVGSSGRPSAVVDRAAPLPTQSGVE